MALTVEDKVYIQDIVTSSITSIVEGLLFPRFDALERDSAEMKQDFTELRQDVAGLKQDVAELGRDLTGLRQDVAILKQDVIVLKQSVAALQLQAGIMSERMDEIDGRLIAIEADVKELYAMHTDNQRLKKSHAGEAFSRFSTEEQIKILNQELQITADAIGITLPRRTS